MSSTPAMANLNKTSVVSRASLDRPDRPRQYPGRLARHRAAEKVARDAPRISPIEIGRKIDVGVDFWRIEKYPVIDLPDDPPGMTIERRGQHKTLLLRVRASHCQLQRPHAEQPVDIALPEVDRERCAHEYRVEFLAADQSCVLHTSIRRIHRGKEARGPEKLQRIDYEIKRGRHNND